MKIGLFVLAFVLVVQVQAQRSFSGTLGANLWTPPSLSSGSCSIGSSSNVPYQIFNSTFATASIQAIQGLAGPGLGSSLQLLVYARRPSLSNPCANLLSVLGNRYGARVPTLDDWIFLNASTYYFIASGAAGQFAFDIYASTKPGEISSVATAPQWNLPYYYDDGQNAPSCTNLPSTNAFPFGQYTWTQATTGFYDIYVLAQRKDGQQLSALGYVLYQGSPSAASISADACGASSVISGGYSSTSGVLGQYVKLVAGSTYSIAFGPLETAPFQWAVRVVLTKIRFFSSLSYTQPRGSSGASDCSPNYSYSSVPWFSMFVNATGGPLLIDLGGVDSKFQQIDTYSFLYNGVNSAVPPQSCPSDAPLVDVADTGDISTLSYSAQPKTTLTVIASSYSSSPSISSYTAVAQYVFGGKVTGGFPSTREESSSSLSSGSTTIFSSSTTASTTASSSSSIRSTAATTVVATTSFTTTTGTTGSGPYYATYYEYSSTSCSGNAYYNYTAPSGQCQPSDTSSYYLYCEPSYYYLYACYGTTTCSQNCYSFSGVPGVCQSESSYSFMVYCGNFAGLSSSTSTGATASTSSSSVASSSSSTSFNGLITTGAASTSSTASASSLSTKISSALVTTSNAASTTGATTPAPTTRVPTTHKPTTRKPTTRKPTS